MKSVRGVKLTWDDWNKEHLKKHRVSIGEAEQAFQNKFFVKQSYLNRVVIFGKTDAGRFLAVVLSFEKQKDGYVVSARDAGKKERKNLK